MRPVVLHIAASRDGFIATEDDGLAWLPPPTEAEDFGMKAFMAQVDCVVMGRRTWEIAQTLEESPFSAYDRHICSRAGEAAETLIRRLKEGEGGVIWLLGGGQLNACLLKADLIDSIVVTEIPVTLNAGIALFGSLGTAIPSQWKREDVRTYTGGIVQTTWVR